jgi:hypothetical protein
MPKEKLPAGLVFQCQDKVWMTNEFMMDWVKVKHGMLVLDSFKGHLHDRLRRK